MRTVVLGPWDGELAALVERRRSTGADLFDEVWEGDYHLVPAPHPTHGQLDQQMAELLGPPARARSMWLARVGEAYEPISWSDVLGLDGTAPAASLEWPGQPSI